MQRARRALTAPIALLVLALFLPGCSTWQPIRQPIEHAVPEPGHEESLLIKLRDGSKLEVLLGGVDADSLRGWHKETVKPTHRSERPTARRGEAIAIARADIVAIEKQRFDAVLTVAGILITAGFIGLIGAASVSTGW